jgi:hypothetical protein
MTTPVTPVGHLLDLLEPPFEQDAGDWEQILERAGLAKTLRRRSGRPVLIPAIAVAAAAVVVASALAATGLHPLSAFSSWFAGKPGRPAPAAAERRFRSSPGEQSWDAFPTGTKLRLLVSGVAGGKRYVLYGFRSGNSLCLSLDVNSVRYSYRPGCAAASTLRQLDAPILLVGSGANWSSAGNLAPPPELSVGIVADGVSAVEVNTIDGTHAAWVGGNAYLWVESEPSSGDRVLSLTAISHGRKTTVQAPMAANAFGPAPPLSAARGPTRLEATILHPTIGWLERHELVGLAPSRLETYPQIRRLIAASGFTRFIKPDPLSNVIVGVSARRLFYGGGLWGGSNPPYFDRGPLHLFYPPRSSSQQFVSLTGIAADGVRRIEVFLADGEVETAALKDNVFTALVRRSPPVRVVAYDRTGLVVGIQTLDRLQLFSASVPAAAGRHLKPVLTVRGPHGTTATVAVGRAVANVRCWRASFGNGRSQSGCEPRVPPGRRSGVPAIRLLGGVQPAGGDVFVIANTQPPVARAGLRFADGETITARPVGGLVVFAIPDAQLSRHRQRALLVAFDRHGRQIDRVSYRNGHVIRATRVSGPKQLRNTLEPSVFFRATA